MRTTNLKPTKNTNSPKRKIVKIDSASEGYDSQPLSRKKEVESELPWEALGALAPAIKAAHDMTQAPLAICASCCLATVTLCVQGFANIAVSNLFTTVPSLFILILGGSGERKSTVEALFNRAVRDHEAELRKEYRGELIEYELDVEIYKAQRREALNSKDPEIMRESLYELGPQPEPPLRPNLTMQDATVEGMVRVLREGQPSIGIFSDEGARLLHGYGMSTRNNSFKSAAFFSQFWSGTPIELTRAGFGENSIEGKRVTMSLMVQPEIGNEFIANEAFDSQGLLSRFLACFPDSTVGSRMIRNLDSKVGEETENDLDDFCEKLTEILNTPLPLLEETRNILAPRTLPLSSKAVKVFKQYHDEIEEKLAEGGAYSGHRGLANKSPENAVRIAGVLTLFDNLDANNIHSKKMTAGIMLARYYLDEAVQITCSAVNDQDLNLAEKLLDWAKKRGGIFALVEVYQLGPTSIRKKATAKRIIEILLDHNQIKKLPNGRVINDQYRREVYKVVA
jgi:hypothetical protein